MKKLLCYLRKVIPHNSPLRLWYTRLQQVAARVLMPIDTSNIKLIGVTGTDGKTTTTEMLAHMLSELDISYLSTSSLEVKINDTVLTASKRTTPSLWQLHKLLRQAMDDGIEVAVLEVSSHALAQWRVLGLKFDIAILTNITHEHLNFHKTRENYANTKKLLFTKHLKENGIAILPNNDDYGNKWLKEFNELYSTPVPYSPKGTSAVTDKYGTTFIYHGKQYTMPMLGNYNAGNAIAAALAVSSLKIPSTQAKTAKHPRAASLASQSTSSGLAVSADDALYALSNFTGIPGRMQVVHSGDITCIVDFALTERAMSSALATAREIAQDNNVLVVFGATGGQHDASVHPGLAKAAATGADIVIVTDDEPYDGDPTQIRTNLITHIQGAQTDCEHHDIADRRSAIAKALSRAKAGDVLIVTGMGHYTSRTVNGKEVPWNDAQVITEELQALT